MIYTIRVRLAIIAVQYNWHPIYDHIQPKRVVLLYF
jgi:hypothetical protein